MNFFLSECVSIEGQVVETRSGAAGLVRAIPSVAAPSLSDPSPAVQQFPSCRVSALSPWREFISMKSSLFSDGDNFLSEIIHNKSDL